MEMRLVPSAGVCFLLRPGMSWGLLSSACSGFPVLSARKVSTSHRPWLAALCASQPLCSSSGPPLSSPSSLLSLFLLGELFILFGGNQQLISLVPGNVLHWGLLPDQAAVTTQACAVAPGLVAADPACHLVPDLCIAAWRQALQAARGLIPRDVPAGIHLKQTMDTSQVRE